MTPEPSTGEPGDLWLWDVSALVALTLTSHVHHRAAHAALRDRRGAWATTPLTEAALVRLLLNPTVTGRAFAPTQVLSTVAGLHADPRWRWLPDDTSLVTPLIDTTVLAGHRQVTDLHLVNLAARHGAVLATFDAALLPTLAPADRRHVQVLRQ